MSIFFTIGLLFFVCVAINHLTGVNLFSGVVTLVKAIVDHAWIALRVILGIALGGVCLLGFSTFGSTVAIIATIVGLILGILLISIIRWALRNMRWWGILLVVLTLITALVAAIF